MYLWELVGHDTSEGVLLSGIDDDLASVMRTGGVLLEQRRGFIVRIVEAVSRLSVCYLDVIYVPTGRNWLGRRTVSGGAHWEYTYRSVEPAVGYTLSASQDVSAVAS